MYWESANNIEYSVLLSNLNVTLLNELEDRFALLQCRASNNNVTLFFPLPVPRQWLNVKSKWLN